MATTTTADSLPIAESSRPPNKPYAQHARGQQDYVASPSSPTDAEAQPIFFTAHAAPVRPPLRSAISVVVDAGGQFVAEDQIGAVYGAGATRPEAVADFYSALDRRLEFLRTHRHQLHPALLRELGALERLFPGR
jgi:hypothetical protein